MSDDWPAADTLLAARYRLVTLLETGGMAEVWRAEDELLGRPVAVKLPTGSQVVWREARMAAKLQHPGIAAVHDYREAVRPDGTVAPFVVMELLAGESVAAHIEREPFSLPEAARIGAAVADALAAAHANGVVHRDIKPGNVMLTPNGVKILDFGISAAAGEPDDDDTGATFGTPAYVAPERLDGMPAEPATDVYGLGVLLFEMVTGDPPYPVETWEELAEARAAGPHTLPEDLPATFRELVARCLDEDPAARPGAEEIRFDLTAFWLNDLPEPAFPPPAPDASGQATSGPAASRHPSLDRVVSRHPSLDRAASRHPSLDRAAPPRPPSGRVVSAQPEPVGALRPGRAGAGPRVAEWPAAKSGFAQGRAPAATLRLEQQAPSRKIAVTVALVALLVAVGSVFALMNWRPNKPTEAAPEPSSPASASTPPQVLDAPPSAAPTTTSASPSAKPTPRLTFADAVSRMRAAIEDGADAGEIRSDVATDLLNLLRNLSGASGRDVGTQVDQLRRKIQERTGEGSLEPSRATILRARVADLDRAAGT